MGFAQSLKEFGLITFYLGLGLLLITVGLFGAIFLFPRGESVAGAIFVGIAFLGMAMVYHSQKIKE